MPRRKVVSDFDISNEYREVYYTRFSHKEYRSFLKCSDKSLPRQKRAQKLLDYLCGKFDLPAMRVRIIDEPQLLRGGRTYEAFYYFKSHFVKVYNLSRGGKPVSIKIMAITLLHEFMHHYDRYFLEIESTPHTKGFFARIKDLRSKLE